MILPVAVVLFLLHFVGIALASGAEACPDKLPAWSIKDLKKKARDAVGSGVGRC